MFTSYLQTLVEALGFLTRIPFPSSWFSKKQCICETAWAFPFAGALIGLIGGCGFLIFWSFGFGAALSSLLAITLTIIITGALHEDGLSDVADGFFSKNNAADRLTVMKDSHIGVFAAIALMVSFSFRVLILARLSNNGAFVAFFSLIALEGISRGFMVWFWGTLPLARKGGTAAAAGEPSIKTRKIALMNTVVLAFLFLFLPLGFWPFLISLLLGWFVMLGFTRLCAHKINGYTGDTLGACQQLTWAAAAIGIVVGCNL